jgi:hypothetical protein
MPPKRNKPGPKANPVLVLRSAAVEYAYAVEVYESSKDPGAVSALVHYWDRLRKAAIRYKDAPKARGRPDGAVDRNRAQKRRAAHAKA